MRADWSRRSSGAPAGRRPCPSYPPRGGGVQAPGRTAALPGHQPGPERGSAPLSAPQATGARRGELLALTWGPGGVELEQRTVTIAASLCLRRGELGPTKSGKGRVVPIGPTAVARMREWRMAAGRPADGTLVFPFPPRQSWERVRAGAGIAAPLPTIHSLRHTAAAWWLASGLTVHAVAELLGHADPTLVIKRCGHALPSERSAADERLEAFLAEAGGR